MERIGLLCPARQLEREAGSVFLWLPVALAAGIGLYYSLPLEPGLAVIAGSGAWLALLLYICWRRPTALSALLAALLAGLLLAKFDAAMSGTPLVSAVSEPLRFRGVIERIDRRIGRQATLTVAITSLDALPAHERPRRIRLTAPWREDLRVGRPVSGSARLFPLVGPVAPGAFDYGRIQWLRGIGASGRAFQPLEVDELSAAGPLLAARDAIESLRSAIGTRIAAVIPGSLGAIATALITGKRDDIAASTNESLQASGLAHVISISGLHMSLVAGGFFWLVRALLALSPALVVKWPIKKWAALGALAVGAFYLLLSGAEVPTQRSYIMLAIMFGAILVDRPALSLRNVAIAALVVLAVEPAAVLDAGFQMSFLAVAGLVSFFEAAREKQWFDPAPHLGSNPVFRPLRHAANGLIFGAASSLIAGVCTSPVAAFHFNRIAVYGLLANLLALPVVSFIVMPMALTAAFFMPLGLERLPLLVMGFGLDAVMAISDWTANLPGAQVVAPGFNLAGAALMAFGLLWVSIHRAGLKCWGVAFFGLGLLVAGIRSEPDILIERTARNVALRNASGDLVPALARRGTFAMERWLLSDGDRAKVLDAYRRPGWSCRPEVCLAAVEGRKIAFLTERAEQDFSCPEVDLVIAAFPLRGRCKNVPLRIDRFDVWRNGAYSISVDEGGFEVTTARDQRGSRPWTFEPTPRKRAYGVAPAKARGRTAEPSSSTREAGLGPQ
jgi:competence protein ComEC